MEKPQETPEAPLSLRDRVLNWIIPPSIIGEAFNGLQQESAQRTVEMFTQDQIPGFEE